MRAQRPAPRSTARTFVHVLDLGRQGLVAFDLVFADPPYAWNEHARLLAGVLPLLGPDGELALAQVVVYLGTAPKSNAVYTAFAAARASAKATGSLMPPAHILNAPTKLMKNLGYGAGYQYDHGAEDAFSGQNYFPDGMARERFYQPKDRGFEREVGRRLEYWDKLRAGRSVTDGSKA